ncbi:uncharacterized protein [Watersipora subatra]|uniref:uncharacterized protein isoform X2 n=1 Tax=Watersipora subatra TaxID=2589382 RepID=UPI00355B6CDB
MILAALCCLRIFTHAPAWWLSKTNRVIRRAALFGLRFSGLLLLLGLGFGLNFLSWLLARFLYRKSKAKSSDARKCSTDSLEPDSACSKRSHSSLNGSQASVSEIDCHIIATPKIVKMGNIDSRDASPIWLSTLQEKDTIDDDYIVGAEIHEHKTGRTLSGRVAMRCLATPAEVSAHTHSDPTIDRVHDTDTRELRAMEDSGFLEPSKQTPLTFETVDKVKSSKVISSNVPDEARSGISDSLGSNKPCLTRSIKNDCQNGYGEKVPTSVNYPVRLMGAHQHSAELEDNDSIYKTQTAAAHNVNVKLATPQPRPLETLDINELSAVKNLENPEELDDLLSISTPLRASADSKRKAFIARRDAQSLPSLAPSPRRLSRSASLRSEQSFELENFDEITPSISFSEIEAGISLTLRDLAQDLACVHRLSNMNTAEFYDSHETTVKLSNLIGTVVERFPKDHIDKGFDLLRKLRTAADGPRMSSLPPTPASGRPTDFYADNKLVESKSFHDLPHVVLLEGVDCHMTLELAEEGADDGQSLNSVSTTETNLPSDNYDSLPSMDATDVICSCIEEGESLEWDGILVDVAGYLAREWKGKTEKAAAIRKGYGCVINQHQYKHLALIRGDNYCSLRAAYCSMILNHIIPGIELKEALPRLEAVYLADPLLFNSWVFPECMIDAATDSSSYHQLSLCLQFFVSHVSSHTTDSGRPS